MLRLAVFASAVLGVSAFGMPSTIEETDSPTAAPTKWGDTDAPTASPTQPTDYCACDHPAYPLCVPQQSCKTVTIGKKKVYDWRSKAWKYVPVMKKVCESKKMCRSKYSYLNFKPCKGSKGEMECTANFQAPSKPPTVAPDGCACQGTTPFCEPHCHMIGAKKVCTGAKYCRKSKLPLSKDDKFYSCGGDAKQTCTYKYGKKYCKPTYQQCSSNWEVPQCTCPEEFSYCVDHCYYYLGKKYCTGKKKCRGKNTPYMDCDKFNKKEQCTNSFGDSPTAFPTIAPTNTTEIDLEMSDDMA